MTGVTGAGTTLAFTLDGRGGTLITGQPWLQVSGQEVFFYR